MRQIIAFAGRKHSGKTALAMTLVKKGFTRISFAGRLKDLCCEVFDLDPERINDKQYKEQEFEEPRQWNQDAFDKFAVYVPFIQFDNKDKSLTTAREILEFLGTEVIRRYNPSFHVDYVRSILENNPNTNYVIDDLRYMNELALAQLFGAIAIFIIRPYYKDYSNYTAEVTLTRADFNHVIINDGSLKSFLKNFKRYSKELLRQKDKDNVFRFASVESAFWAGFIAACGHMKSRSIKVRGVFEQVFELSKFVGPKNINDSKKIKNAMIVEDLKLWGIGSKNYNRVPYEFWTHDSDSVLVRSWIHGLLVGSKPNNGIVASKEIVEFVQGFFPDLQGVISKEKVENLYRLSYNEFSVEFLERLNKEEVYE